MAQCGLLNLATCIPEKIFSYLVDIINAPFQPLMALIKALLSEPVNLALFVSVWVIIVYMISMFYGFVFLWAGFNFMISGYDAEKREKAKLWLTNTVIMIILVQASFFIYELILELSGTITNAILSLVDPNFFLLTFDNLPNIGLQLVFGGLYLVTLLLTTLVLIIRYAFVALGILIFPIAIFFYFIPPLRSYGSFFLHFLGNNIFVTALDAILLVGFSKLINVGIFGNVKILIMISALTLIDVIMLFLLLFSIIKAALSGLGFVAKVGALVAQVV